MSVGVVDDVPRCGLDGVAGVAALRSHVIPELCRVGPLVAAALSGLHLHGSQLLHESRLLVGAGKLCLPEAVSRLTVLDHRREHSTFLLGGLCPVFIFLLAWR